MHRHFDDHLNVRELIEEVQPEVFVECGVKDGDNTLQLVNVCKRLVSVSDGPIPALLHEILPWMTYVQALSYDVLGDIPCQMVSIDTDHNYWTLDKELKCIERLGMVVVIHDICQEGNGFQTEGYGIGCYPHKEILREERPYKQAIEDAKERGWTEIRRSEECNGAVAMRYDEIPYRWTDAALGTL